MWHLTPHSLCLALLCVFLCLVKDAQADDHSQDVADTKMLPIHISDFEHPGDVAKRANDLSQLDPRTSDSYYWGNTIANGTGFAFVSTTMYTDDGERLVSIERFKPMLKSLECGEHMVLTFNSNETFQYAINAWNWVNENETHAFIMIADGDPGCGPDEDRVPYYIYNADYDEEKFVAHLYGTEKKWEDVAHTFDLEAGGSPGPHHPEGGLAKRFPGFMEAEKKWRVPVDLKLNFPLFFVPLIPPGYWRIDCIDCGTAGFLEFSAKLKVEAFVPTETSFNIAPKFRIDFGMRLFAKIFKLPRPSPDLSYSKAYHPPIPLGGFPLGPFAFVKFRLQGKVGASISALEGELSVDFGSVGGFGEDAIATLDIFHPWLTKVWGWLPSFTPKPFKVNKADFGLDFEIFHQLSVGASLDVLGIPAFEAVVVGRVPKNTFQIDKTNKKGRYCDKQGKIDGISIDRLEGYTAGIRVGTPGDLALTQDVWPAPVFNPHWGMKKRSLDGGNLLPSVNEKARRRAVVAARSVDHGMSGREIAKRGEGPSYIRKRFNLGIRFKVPLLDITTKYLGGWCIGGNPKPPALPPPPPPGKEPNLPPPPPGKEPNPPPPPPPGKEPNPLPPPLPPGKEPNPPPPPPPGKEPNHPPPPPPENNPPPPPPPENDPELPPPPPRKTIKCPITPDGQGLNMRKCAGSGKECPSVGQFHGTPEKMVAELACYEIGEDVKGNKKWGQLPNRLFVALAFIDMKCSEQLEPCTIMA